MDRKTLEQKLLCYRSDRARAEYLRRYIPLMEKRLSELKEEALQGIGKALPPRCGAGILRPGGSHGPAGGPCRRGRADGGDAPLP